MKKIRRETVFALIILLSGFWLGTFLPELFRMGTGTYASLLSVYSLEKFESTAVSPEKILPYITGIRLRTLLFLWMSCYTSVGPLFHLAYAWWLAASAGMLLSLFMLREGAAGVLLFFCCLFPQWLLYASMWKQELRFLFRMRYPGRAELAEAVISRTELSERELYQTSRCAVTAIRKSEFLVLAKLAAFCIAGCMAEAFFGSWSIKIFLQIFT